MVTITIPHLVDNILEAMFLDPKKIGGFWLSSGHFHLQGLWDNGQTKTMIKREGSGWRR
jgi:hypothetical protein